MFFQFNTSTGDFIQAFEKPRKFSCLVNGETVTRGPDFFKHTSDVMALSGIQVGTIIKPALGYGKKHLSPVDDAAALTRTYPVADIPNLSEKESQSQIDYMARLDVSAGRIRRLYVPDQLLEEEYRRTEDLVRKWVIDGEDTNSIPLCLQTEIDRGALAPTVVAGNILTLADSLNTVLDTVRDIRLKGKDAISAASGEAILSEYEDAIMLLDALIPAT
jgi:hypothetical protein